MPTRQFFKCIQINTMQEMSRDIIVNNETHKVRCCSPHRSTPLLSSIVHPLPNPIRPPIYASLPPSPLHRQGVAKFCLDHMSTRATDSYLWGLPEGVYGREKVKVKVKRRTIADAKCKRCITAGKVHRYCVACGGAEVCVHKKQKRSCKLCKGLPQVENNRKKTAAAMASDRKRTGI
jgi:hypothetical protein